YNVPVPLALTPLPRVQAALFLRRPVNIQTPPFPRPQAAAGGVIAFWVTLARGTHPFPSRTRKLSLSAPMVLHAQVCGRVGSRPVLNHTKAPAKRGPLLVGLRPLPENRLPPVPACDIF